MFVQSRKRSRQSIWPPTSLLHPATSNASSLGLSLSATQHKSPSRLAIPDLSAAGTTLNPSPSLFTPIASARLINVAGIAQEILLEGKANAAVNPNSKCRFCDSMLSSSSNRHRHERSQHPHDVKASLSAPGTSRKRCAAAAFAPPGPAKTIPSSAAAFTTRNVAVVTPVIDRDHGHNRITQAVDSDHEVHTDHEMDLTQPRSPAVDFGPNLRRSDTLARDSKVGAAHAASAGFNSPFKVEIEAKEQHSDTDSEILESKSPEPAFDQDTDVELREPQINGIRNSENGLTQFEGVEWELNISNWSEIEGVRPLLREEDLQRTCYPFLQWLANPPLTQCESLVKQRRIKSLSQLQPIKSNLRFIFALLYEIQVLKAIDLAVLSKLDVCQSLYQAITDRQVGSARIHAIFLLLKKILVYHSSVESARTRQFVQPTASESYMFVEGVCSDSSNRRKQESRNRMVLGIRSNHQLVQSQPQQSREAFRVPETWTAAAVSKAATPEVAAAASPCIRLQGLPGPAAASAAAASSAAESNNSLSKGELRLVTQACIKYLAAESKVAQLGFKATQNAIGSNLAQGKDILFMQYLITATLCLGLAPRSQVLKELRIGSSFVRESDNRYWIKILAELSKNGKPTLFSLASELTPMFDHYLEVVRPRLLAAVGAAEHSHDYVFFKKNGSAPRSDFSSATTVVTQLVLDRAVNAHAFRSAVITTFYDAGASQADMDKLANIMAHDPATARNFYYLPIHTLAAVETNQRMANQLLLPQAQ
jgi:hypothetical protein